MTKLREPGSEHAAIVETLALLTVEEAARATAKSASHLRACGDPDDDRHRLSFADAVKLVEACAAAGEGAPLLSFLRLRVMLATPEGLDPERPDVTAAVLTAVQTTGHAAGALTRAMEDDHLSPAELRDLKARAMALRADADRILVAIEAGDTEKAAEAADLRIVRLQNENNALRRRLKQNAAAPSRRRDAQRGEAPARRR